jgi:Cellulase (glycosyl hydrolase family 5)
MRTLTASLIALALAFPTSAAALPVGYNEEAETLLALPNAVRKANIQLARVGVSWAAVERVDEVYDWSRTDRVVRFLDRSGIRPILSVYGSPAWAGPHVPNVHCPCRRAHDDDWEDFWRELAARYPGVILNVWNEPNYHAYGAVSAERAAELTNLAAEAVWSVEPDRKILGPAASPGVHGWIGYMGALYDRVDPRVEMAANIYPYGMLLPNFRDDLGRLRRIAGHREVWITETGVSRYVIGERRQLRFTRRAYRYARKRVEAIIFHRLWSPYRESAQLLGWDAGLAALRDDASPRPLYRQISRLHGSSGPAPEVPAAPAAPPKPLTLTEVAGIVFAAPTAGPAGCSR